MSSTDVLGVVPPISRGTIPTPTISRRCMWNIGVARSVHRCHTVAPEPNAVFRTKALGTRGYNTQPPNTSLLISACTPTLDGHTPPSYPVAVMNLYLGTRRSMASSSTATAAANPVKDDFPEALTYRYNDNSAWVPAAKSHEASFF